MTILLNTYLFSFLEVFVFSVSETNWKKYPFDWNLTTTIGITYAASPKYDPQLICTAHAHGVRVVALG